jgi:hypothetical protein
MSASPGKCYHVSIIGGAICKEIRQLEIGAEDYLPKVEGSFVLFCLKPSGFEQ